MINKPEVKRPLSNCLRLLLFYKTHTGGISIRQFLYTIPPEQNLQTVEHYLKTVHGYSRRIITRLKQQPEHILLNDRHVRMIDLLHTADQLKVVLTESTDILPNPNLSVEIVYEDEDIIIFNKPASMPVHPARRHLEDTLANFFVYHIQRQGQAATFRPINRLDGDTTGLCLVAKNALSAKLLTKQVQKEYTAILCGLLPENQGEINLPIAAAPDSVIRRQVDPNGQPSITQYSVEQRKNGYTLVRVHLLTGRTHQIRVHFSHLGYPLAGDALYGGSQKDICRHALCCNKLNFIHPISTKPMSFCINIQDDLENLLN